MYVKEREREEEKAFFAFSEYLPLVQIRMIFTMNENSLLVCANSIDFVYLFYAISIRSQ